MSDELATKLRLLAQDIDDAQLVIGHIEARRGAVAVLQDASVVAPAPPAIERAPVDVPSWALPDAPPLTHWQRFGLTYLFVGVVGFVLTALVIITRGLTTMLSAAGAILSTYLAWVIGLPVLLAAIIVLGALCRRGRTFTFQGTGRLF